MASSSTSAILEVSPDSVFATVTDIGGLPEWNAVITRVIEQPDAVVPGAEWVVEMHAMAQTWPSRSRVVLIDPRERRFSYRSCTDDGNPSYALWSWHVADEPVGCRVTVSWDLHPATFWRRVLFARIRAHQLKAELPESLRKLSEAAAQRSSRGSDHHARGA